MFSCVTSFNDIVRLVKNVSLVARMPWWVNFLEECVSVCVCVAKQLCGVRLLQDIMIEEARAILRTWGAAEPNFLLTNSKLTFQMTMIPEKTQYLTQGPDGQRKLRDGPDIASYRGLKIINSRAFSMEEGAPPRDVLRRRVRVAEYYRIPYEAGIEGKSFSFYDESKDAWQKFTWHELLRMAQIGEIDEPDQNGDSWDDDSNFTYTVRRTKLPNYGISTVSVDYDISRALYESMTVGRMDPDGSWQTGFRLERGAEGNLVMNPWYALCGVEIRGDGLLVPGLGIARSAAGIPYSPLRKRRSMRFRRPQIDATGAGGAANFPAYGKDCIDVTKRSEFMFHEFPKILEAFGYTGNKNFTHKAVNGINAIGNMAGHDANGNPADMAHVRARDKYIAYASGQTDLPEADEVQYDRYLQDPGLHGSFRGQPDYSDYSYQIARENFHRFLMLYLQGKADMLPPKAREFFDQFNWQGFGAGVDRVQVFYELLGRVYAFNHAPAGGGLHAAAGPLAGIPDAHVKAVPLDRYELVVVRPNIEHNMLGIIMGRGGLEELGATFWGQTELSCYDDSMHGG